MLKKFYINDISEAIKDNPLFLGALHSCQMFMAITCTSPDCQFLKNDRGPELVRILKNNYQNIVSKRQQKMG